MASQPGATTPMDLEHGISNNSMRAREAKQLKVSEDCVIHVVDDENHAAELTRELGNEFNFTIKGSPEHVGSVHHISEAVS